MNTIDNITYDEISIGQTATYSKTLTEDDLVLFATVSGDVNPVHLDAEFAATTMFKERIGHGAWTGSIISAALALELPGPGTVYLGQNLSFRAPVKVGDTITVNLEVTNKNDRKNYVTLDTVAINQDGTTVAKGSAEVIAPTEKLSLPKPELPPISIG
ncbi:MAG: 3-hydroxybutyryl-CoA dehydratase [Oceanicoccus sp.]|uniref:MaoC/PaaZ C-terminal domain-containing protein n=1 Tax=Oceanicoccus sp. TaxID=2691044 RepID=UPI00262E12D4|nr:MaoC/PaaZ C-terminal domain-containing protein [Oceanicoccus sp.]MCP3907815.1 3-hydroxybutyryl-CoA dehydratase [Oceanicoccus sp.]MDG1771950.1 MaoC/PaaZ C-terminal domain-containing protein [Oceanicoccus sp.]